MRFDGAVKIESKTLRFRKHSRIKWPDVFVFTKQSSLSSIWRYPIQDLTIDGNYPSFHCRLLNVEIEISLISRGSKNEVLPFKLTQLRPRKAFQLKEKDCSSENYIGSELLKVTGFDGWRPTIWGSTAWFPSEEKVPLARSLKLRIQKREIYMQSNAWKARTKVQNRWDQLCRATDDISDSSALTVFFFLCVRSTIYGKFKP